MEGQKPQVIPKECKRLAEVDFPIAEVSRHAAREKSIRHGHPSTLHLWWARRPLASSRAVLMALLLPDPCDAHCPEAFKKQARVALLAMRSRPRGWEDQTASDEGLRKVLLKFIADFANWDNAAAPRYLETARALVRAAHPEDPPLVVDPFAGGGSIPLEALRLGCEAFATDLNPVACLILKVMLEDIPRHGPELAEELRRVGGEIKAAAEKELADFYPTDPDLPAPRRGKFFIYVLKCADASFYIGQTDDIPRRLKEHEAGQVSWTAKHLPVEIVHWEQFDTREAAVKREKDLKTGFGRKWLKREYAAGRLAARQAGGATPIAYLWARTVRCESPNCGAEIPLLRSLWLCKKAKRKRALRTRVVRSPGDLPAEASAQAGAPRVEFEIFEPASEKEVAGGTVARARASCLCCGTVLPPDRVRAQLAAEKGGADAIFDAAGHRIGGARMTAVVTLRPGEQGRHYRLPTEADYAAVRRAQERVAEILGEWKAGQASSLSDSQDDSLTKGLCPVPDEALPPIGTLGFRVQRYGMLEWGDLFTARQKVALVGLGRLTASAQTGKQPLALALTRAANAGCSLCRWDVTRESHQAVYSRQALPVVWDYSEGNPLSASTGGYAGALDWVAKVIEAWPKSGTGQVQSADATDHPLPDQAADVWFTDPPYYDAVPYADLSDFSLVWLKRTLPNHPLLRDPFDPDNPLSPKTREAVQDETKECDGCAKDRAFFEDTMGKAFAEGRRILKEDGIGCVVFAHKTTEGWEALLSGMIRGGWTITGSWPIATEMASRLRARDSAALATSVHLITRPRPEDAPVGDWADVLRELPPRVTAWIERLQREGIRGADLVFACIGPALEVFSRYSSVETAEGREVGLPEYLEKVWEVVGRAALEQVLGSAEAGTLEEDARLVALFLWTLQSSEGANGNGKNGALESANEDLPAGQAGEEEVARVAAKGFSLPFDVVRRFAQPMGIDLEVWTGRVIVQDKGIVRLLPVAERAQALFGEDGAGAAADWIESDPIANLQLVLFPEMDVTHSKKKRRGRKALISDDAELQSPDATTLDRVHAAMLLQAGGQANALRQLLAAEQNRGPDFLRLANALSALYPKGAEEKRLLDAMLLGAPR